MHLSFGKSKSDSRILMKSPEESKKSAVSRNAYVANGAGGSRKTTSLKTLTGPLLASTKFNSILDATTYTNVRSPGFTSRLVQCAINGSSPSESRGKYHDKSSSVGLFPSASFVKHQSPPQSLPLSSLKMSVKTPVRIRIAPPSFKEPKCDPVSTHNTSPNCGSTSMRDLPEDNATSEMENLQEISRKRIFSECVDNSPEDLCKKRQKRSDILFPNPNSAIYHYRHVRAPSIPSYPVSHSPADFLTQGKRARERGSPEEQKRQRRKTCSANNAILSSLSSSRNLLEKLSSQKRKSLEPSRSSSPSEPLSRKSLKENKVSNKAIGVQCNLEMTKINQIETQPKLSSQQERNMAVLKSMETPHRISDDRKVRFAEVGSSSKTEASDCSAKLFRKEISLPLSRLPSKQERKASFWVQPPLADELSSSLLNDDCKLDRPERFQSLLACVSGKETKAQKIEDDKSRSVEDGSKTSCAPCVSQMPSLTHSAGITVTVSSTTTIMTCASVTSVKGGTAPEAGISSKLSPVSSFSSVSSSSVPPAAPQTSLSVMSPTEKPVISPSFSSNSEAPVTASIPTPPTSISQSPLFASLTSSQSTLHSASPFLSSASTLTSTKGPQCVSAPGALPPALVPISSTKPMVPQNGQQNSSSLQITSEAQQSVAQSFSSATGISGFTNGPSCTSSSLSGAGIATDSIKSVVQQDSSKADALKPTFSFGSSSTEASKTSFHFGSVSSGTLKPAAQIAPSATEPLKPAASDSKPAFQFGFGSTSANKPQSPFQTNSFESLKPASQSDVHTVSKPAFQFGSSLPEVVKPTIQFGSSTAGLSKPTFSFGSSGASKPSFQFGSSGSEIPKPVPSFGSVSEATKPALQFTSSNTDSSKQASLFGCSSSEAPRPTFQFGPKSSEESKVAPLFGAHSTRASKPAFQFTSSSTDASKPTLSSQAKSPAQLSFQFGSNSTSVSKPAFQFGSTLGGGSQDMNAKIAAPASTSLSGGEFSFGASNPSSSNGTSVNQGQGAFSFGSSTLSKPPVNSSFPMSSFGSLSTPASSSLSFSAPSTTSASSGIFKCVSTTTGGQTLPTFNAAASPVSNAFNFSSGSISNTPSAAFQFAKSPLGTSSQPVSVTNGNSSTFMFGQTSGSSLGSFQFGGTSVSPVVQTSQSGLFSIGSGSAPQQRRIREIRRRR